MKLVTFSRGGSNPRLGAVVGSWDRWEWIVDLHDANPQLPADMMAFIDAAGGLTGDVWERASRTVASVEKELRRGKNPAAIRPSEATIHVPIHPRLLRDFLAFRGHVARTRAAIGSVVPPEWDALPAYYNGNHLNVVGPGDAVTPLRYTIVDAGRRRLVASSKLDYEAEVGYVLGRGGWKIDAKEAAAHLFGLTIFNDFSARDIQMTAGRIGMGPAPGKDWANALGPCIVTRDELGELRDQSVAVRVNGEERSRGRYDELVHRNPLVKQGERAFWSFPEMVEHLSHAQTIHAGEVWGSGTIPGGCELERGDKARYLNPGDRVEIEIEGIGVLANSIGPAT